MNVLISVGDWDVMTVGAPFSVSVFAVPQFRFVPVSVTAVPTGPVSGLTAVMVGGGHSSTVMVVDCVSTRGPSLTVKVRLSVPTWFAPGVKVKRPVVASRLALAGSG